MIGAAYTMTTKREAHWSEQTKAQNTEKGMYVSLKQPRGDGERYVTPARAAAKETKIIQESPLFENEFPALPSESPDLPDKTNKAHKMHLSDIFWPILGIFGKNFLICYEFLRFKRKISTLYNAF